MNDLVRELVELHGYGAILKCIPEYEHEARRLDRFTKFMKRQESKKKKSKVYRRQTDGHQSHAILIASSEHVCSGEYK